MRLEIAVDRIEDIMCLDRKIDDCNHRVVTEVKNSGTTLTRVCRIGPINAALILGEVGDVSRSRHGITSPATPAPLRSQRRRASINATG